MILRLTAIISPNSINQFIFVMETRCVIFVVGTEFEICYSDELRSSKGYVQFPNDQF
jgi:hypothetical protein